MKFIKFWQSIVNIYFIFSAPGHATYFQKSCKTFSYHSMAIFLLRPIHTMPTVVDILNQSF